MQIPKTARQNEIDLLRVIAALVVYLYHFTDAINYTYNIVPGNVSIGKFSKYGFLGVDLFFIISGYVLTLSAMNKTFKEFWVSRVIRLYPAFWVSCVIALIIPRIVHGVSTFLPYPDIKTFLFNLTMVPSIFGQKMLIPVYWSLFEEIHFYFVISIIIAFRLWNRMLTVILCWLAIYITVALLGWVGPQSGFGVIVPKHSLYFLIGILFYLLRIGYAAKWKIMALLAALFLLSIPYSILIVNYTNLQYKYADGINLGITISINALLFLVFFLIATRRFSIVASPVLTKLGDLTYSFYLIHVSGLALYWYLRNKIQPQVLLLLLLLIITAASWLINAYLEKPMMKGLTRLLKGKKRDERQSAIDNKNHLQPLPPQG